MQLMKTLHFSFPGMQGDIIQVMFPVIVSKHNHVEAEKLALHKGPQQFPNLDLVMGDIVCGSPVGRAYSINWETKGLLGGSVS